MILFHYVDGRYTPVLICDVCEKRIVDGDLAAVVHRHGDPEQAELLPCMYVHKGACHDTAETQMGGADNTGWQELETHLLFLLLNTKITPEKLAAERDRSDEIGYFP